MTQPFGLAGAGHPPPGVYQRQPTMGDHQIPRPPGQPPQWLPRIASEIKEQTLALFRRYLGSSIKDTDLVRLAERQAGDIARRLAAPNMTEAKAQENMQAAMALLKKSLDPEDIKANWPDRATWLPNMKQSLQQLKGGKARDDMLRAITFLEQEREDANGLPDIRPEFQWAWWRVWLHGRRFRLNPERPPGNPQMQMNMPQPVARTPSNMGSGPVPPPPPVPQAPPGMPARPRVIPPQKTSEFLAYLFHHVKGDTSLFFGFANVPD